MGAHSGRWNFLGKFLKENNISSYALELKGFGEDKGLKGHVDSFDVYFKDIGSLYSAVKAKDPEKKVFLLGESMGALILFVLSAVQPDLSDGLICISPAFKSKMKFNFLKYLDIFLSSSFRPKKQFNMPFTSEMCTRDEVYLKEMEGDDREHRLATSALLVQTALAQIKAAIVKSRVNVPVLFLLAEEDYLIDSRTSEKIFSRLRTKDKELNIYPGMHHALSIDVGREDVFIDILCWIKERL